MIAIPWLIDNSSWIVPAVGWISSEVLGILSGGKKASVLQVVMDFLKSLPDLIASTLRK